MRLINADAFDKCLENAEVEAIHMRKHVFASAVNVIRGNLRSFPTIEERKKGQWMVSYLEHEAMGIRPKLLYCSECCQCIAYPTNYCPNCGADMRGENDGKKSS